MGNLKLLNYVLLALSICLLASCSKDDDFGPQGEGTSFNSGYRNPESSEVLILNEGNFGLGNASLDVYYPEEKSLNREVYNNTNGGKLGDVGQSITIIDNKVYVVVNNSARLIELSAADFIEISNKQVGKSPRYLIPVSDDELWLTDLGSEYIWVLNRSGLVVVDSIYSGGWTERGVVADNRVFISMPHNDQVLVIDSDSRQVIDSIKTHSEPVDVMVGADNKLWVLSTGGTFPREEKGPALERYDIREYENIETLSMNNASAFAYRMESNLRGDTIYVLANSLERFVISSSGIERTTVLSGATSFYGLGVDPNNGDIYLTDPKNYTSEGRVYRYSSKLLEKDTLNVGYLPQHISFSLKY